MTYDSRADTLLHTIAVGQQMMKMIHEALDRALVHDLSKTQPPEVEVFDEVTPLLKTLTYGTSEYSASLASMGPALKHHYSNNRHHPEYFEYGVNGMTLVDLIEMLADWKAATLRMENGDLAKSLEIQRKRFGISPQLMDILWNTALHFGMVDARPEPEERTDSERPEALDKLAALEKVKELLEVQGRHGNWDYDPYMRGMYNGMELIIAVMENREPSYRDKPLTGYCIDNAKDGPYEEPVSEPRPMTAKGGRL